MAVLVGAGQREFGAAERLSTAACEAALARRHGTVRTCDSVWPLSGPAAH